MGSGPQESWYETFVTLPEQEQDEWPPPLPQVPPSPPPQSSKLPPIYLRPLLLEDSLMPATEADDVAGAPSPKNLFSKGEHDEGVLPGALPPPPTSSPAVVRAPLKKAVEVATPPEINSFLETMAASQEPLRPTTTTNANLRKMAGEKEAEIDKIKALTMHRMVHESGEGSNTKKLVFFTNHQAELFNLELIPTLLAAFNFPKPKLVITFLPCSGGSHTINYGMLSGFKKLKASSPTFTEDWKALLQVQAQNDPNKGIRQDVLPIAPFFSETDLLNAEWKIECFMRDVLVPLAAETNALIIGSAFKNASLMMMFARVAASLDSKYGGIGRQTCSMRNGSCTQ